jgi:glycosyltransferase involved in cell wall biosynthesis
MAKRMRRFTDKSVTVTPFGVDLTKFRRLSGPSLFSAGDTVIGTVKALETKYGIEYLIRAFKILRGALPSTPVKLLIVGSGSQKEHLESLVRDLGVWQDTRFVGPVAHDRVPEYLNMLDIAVMASVQDSESFGVSVIEASACCKPVVVSDVGGLPEVVEDGVTGLVVKAKSEEAIAAALERLVLDPDLRTRMGEAGRDRVRRLYDWNVNVEQMLGIYTDVIRSGGAR